MKTELYIPKKLRVGFVTRDDTFTKKLAYVIYYDEKNKLRKETSWQSWRDHKIEPVEFANTPVNAHTFNKGVQRDRYWSSGGRSMIRVYDPRDFEFEVTIDNLMGLLMHSDVSKRELTQDCVFAWYGTELVLLPTNSIEYQESLKHTAKLNAKFSAKDLQLGHTYIRKRPDNPSETLVYLGRHDYHDVESVYMHSLTPVKPQLFTATKRRRHIFMDPETRAIYHKLEPSTHISSCVDPSVHAKFSFLMDDFSKDAASQDVVDVVVKCASVSADEYRALWLRTEAGLLVRIERERWNSYDGLQAIAKRIDNGDPQVVPFLANRAQTIGDILSKLLYIDHNPDGTVKIELNRIIAPGFEKAYEEAVEFSRRYRYSWEPTKLKDFPAAGYKYHCADWDSQIPYYDVGQLKATKATNVWGNVKIHSPTADMLQQLFDQHGIGEVYAVFRDGTHSKKPLGSTFGF